MASLIVKLGSRKSVVQLNDRASIGSSASSDCVIDGVASTQAQIRRDGRNYVLIPVDAGQAVMVNGEHVSGRHCWLRNGDQISIGEAVLVFQDQPGQRAKAKQNGGSGHADKRADRGSNSTVTFYCQCGNRLRARKALAGRHGKCKRCGERVQIPHTSTDDAQAEAKPSQQVAAKQGPEIVAAETVEEICCICQCPIELHDEMTVCDACGLPFHQECWGENLGCAAYGCRNVDALKQGADISIDGQALPLEEFDPLPYQVPAAQPVGSASEEMPWEFLFLAASVLAALVSIITCGFPSLMVAASACVYAAKMREPNFLILAAVWGVSGIAFLVGAVLSYFLWAA